MVLDSTRTPSRSSALAGDMRTARGLRHTEPSARLCHLPFGGGRTAQWAAVKEELGIVLPADCKQLVRTYGGGLFAAVLRLLQPGYPDAAHDLDAANDLASLSPGDASGVVQPVPARRGGRRDDVAPHHHFTGLDDIVAPHPEARTGFEPGSNPTRRSSAGKKAD
ncbi:hypothetical protein ACFC51_33935 [Streptomyces sp. NPDC055962]|uniref:hypothetical protein n=2 Tax=unclassified Streptomyces TaxID=2593676 RepID=UPI0035D620F8